MPLPVIALGISAGLGAIKAFQGASQQRRARRIRRRAQRRLEDNPFRTPTEALQALDSSRIQASQSSLPGENILTSQIEGAVGSAQQSTREAASSPQDIIGAATQNYESLYVNPLRNLRVSAAQRQDQNQETYRNQLNNIAQFRQKEWEQNVLLPYQRATQTAGQLASAGQQNTFSGISDIAGGVANFGLAGGFGGAAAGAAGGATPQVNQSINPQLAPQLNNSVSAGLSQNNPLLNSPSGRGVFAPSINNQGYEPPNRLSLPGFNQPQNQRSILNTNNMNYYG